MLPRHITCARSLLRPWRADDRAALLRHIDDRAVSRNLRLVPHPYTDDDATAWLSVVVASPPPEGNYAIEVDGGLVGAIGLQRGTDIESQSFEVGYWLGRTLWGRGIMTDALRAVTAAGFAEPDVARIYAPVFAWNPASMRVLEKAGYRREAVLVRSGVKEGTLIDRVVYAITRDVGLPYVAAPPPGDA
ncbi:MAG TPA: GNAT family N-acetyltransferase [Gemmatimonadaceae bacterium]|nr:GNAT family N-acetyltransferase [Gemmatimonadaceae bacterium]